MTELVVHEGESAFLTVTLFSLEGETALDIDDIDGVEWKRTVKATGQEVVALVATDPNPPSTNPFTLEQTAVHNTRQNTDWKHERHRVEVTYTYTYNAASGKVGKFAQDVLIIPADYETYCALHERSRFMMRVTAGDASKDMIQTEDILECEEFADERIDALLGKSFKDTSLGIPPLIRQIADMLGSAHARHYLHVAQDTAVSKYAEALEQRAEAMIAELVSHKMGIRYLDGTWDDGYPAPSAHSAITTLGSRKGQVLDHRRPFHDMEEFTPSDDDDEETGYDQEDRGTRKTEW